MQVLCNPEFRVNATGSAQHFSGMYIAVDERLRAPSPEYPQNHIRECTGDTPPPHPLPTPSSSRSLSTLVWPLRQTHDVRQASAPSRIVCSHSYSYSHIPGHMYINECNNLLAHCNGPWYFERKFLYDIIVYRALWRQVSSIIYILGLDI